MNFSTENFKVKAARLFVFLQSYGLAFILLFLIVLFGFFTLQKYLDSRQIQRETQHDLQYEAERKLDREEKARLIEVFNQQHKSTVEIIESVKMMNDSIGKLVENDRQQDAAVNNLREEYQNARNQNSPDKKTAAVRVRRRALPLLRRENDVLATDAELYADRK